MIARHNLKMQEQLANRRSLDLTVLASSNTRLLCFGEDHSRVSLKEFVARNMLIFKEMGYTHLGLESLCSDQWPNASDFNQGGSSDPLKRHMLGRNCFRYCPEAYAGLMVAARENGLTVVPLDLSLDRQFQSSNSGQNHNYKRAERDIWMARTAALFLKTGGKMIALVGYEHLSLKHSFPGFLSGHYGLPAVSVMLAGGMIGGGTALERVIDEAKLTSEAFMLSLDHSLLEGERMVVWDKDNPYSLEREGKLTDWVVHLPETEENRATELLGFWI